MKVASHCYCVSPSDGAFRFDVVVEEGDGGAMAAVLLYRPETLTVELRLPAHLHLPEIKRFSPVLLRPVKVPLRDSGEGESGTRATPTEWCRLKMADTTD